MSTATKQLADNEVIVRLIALHERKFSEEHADGWRNEVASDMNHLVEREIYNFETHGLVSDYSAAVLRIVERVAEFEEIKSKEKPNV